MDIVDRKHQFGVALLRIAVGIIFLTAGLEKILGTDGWSAAGFLQYGTAGTMGWPWVPGGPRDLAMVPGLIVPQRNVSDEELRDRKEVVCLA